MIIYFFHIIKYKYFEFYIIEQTINWLKVNISPENEVVANWICTFDDRRNLLIKQNLTIQKYLEDFQCLQLAKGYNFVRI